MTAEQAPTLPSIAEAIGALRGVPTEQLLDLAIAKLKAAVPVKGAPPIEPVAPVRFHLVSIAKPEAGR